MGVSPYFALYGREVIIPADNFLGIHEKYYGDEFHKHMLARNHEIYRTIYRNLQIARKRTHFYANRRTRLIPFQINDPVFYRRFNKKSKLEPNWTPYYRIIEKVSDRTFLIKSQLDNSVIKSHINHLRLANIGDWDIPANNVVGKRPIRRCRYVLPPDAENNSSTNNTQSSIIVS